jgi:hypothetical protein
MYKFLCVTQYSTKPAVEDVISEFLTEVHIDMPQITVYHVRNMD